MLALAVSILRILIQGDLSFFQYLWSAYYKAMAFTFFFLTFASSQFVKLVYYLFYESKQDTWLAWLI